MQSTDSTLGVGTPNTSSFPKFPNLPSEIRLQIWNLAMPRERLLHVYVKVLSTEEDDAANIANSAGIAWQGNHYRYHLYVNGFHAYPKFFRVNREAREEAKRFYRASLPCSVVLPRTPADFYEARFPLRNPIEQNSRLWAMPYSPEYDIWQLHFDDVPFGNGRGPEHFELFFQLLQDIKNRPEYVPSEGDQGTSQAMGVRHTTTRVPVGLVRIAIDARAISFISLLERFTGGRTPRSPSRGHLAFTEWLDNLEEVLLIQASAHSQWLMKPTPSQGLASGPSAMVPVNARPHDPVFERHVAPFCTTTRDVRRRRISSMFDDWYMMLRSAVPDEPSDIALTWFFDDALPILQMIPALQREARPFMISIRPTPKEEFPFEDEALHNMWRDWREKKPVYWEVENNCQSQSPATFEPGLGRWGFPLQHYRQPVFTIRYELFHVDS